MQILCKQGLVIPVATSSCVALKLVPPKADDKYRMILNKLIRQTYSNKEPDYVLY